MDLWNLWSKTHEKTFWFVSYLWSMLWNYRHCIIYIFVCWFINLYIYSFIYLFIYLFISILRDPALIERHAVVNHSVAISSFTATFVWSWAIVHLYCDVMASTSTVNTCLSRSFKRDLPCLRMTIRHQNMIWTSWKVNWKKECLRF